jgi:hypothetical protein
MIDKEHTTVQLAALSLPVHTRVSASFSPTCAANDAPCCMTGVLCPRGFLCTRTDLLQYSGLLCREDLLAAGFSASSKTTEKVLEVLRTGHLRRNAVSRAEQH